MSDQNTSQNNPQMLTAKLSQHIKELAAATDAARLGDEMLLYLDTCSKFHRYSPSNIWLIAMSRPDASQVAGYQMWQSLGRYVKKGERGIPIFAPIFKTGINKDGLEERSLVGFKVAYVFDISQTDGKPLPKPPDWKSPQKNALLHDKLIQFANSKGITVNIVKLSGEIQGISKGGVIDIAPEAGTKTLIHEITHELLHHQTDRPMDHNFHELEAESVAYVVSKHLGLEGLNSPNYLALYGASSEMITQHLDRIRTTAAEIIAALEA